MESLERRSCRFPAAQNRFRVSGLPPVSALTTAENVAIPLILQRRDWDELIQEAVANLEIVGLKARAHTAAGETQRR